MYAVSLDTSTNNLNGSISNDIKVYKEPVTRTTKIPHCAVQFEANEKNRFIYERLY